jgi:hypothetical protein
MRSIAFRLIGIATLAVAVGACGGSAPAAPTDAGESAGVASEPAETNTTASEPAGGDGTASPDDGGVIGSGGGSACDLLTADEAGTVLGIAGLDTVDTPGEVSSCIYANADGAVVGTTYTPRGGDGLFSVYLSGGGMQSISGVGDGALFDPSSATLIVRKGDSLFAISAGTGRETEEQRLDWAKQLAAIAVGRM